MVKAVEIDLIGLRDKPLELPPSVRRIISAQPLNPFTRVQVSVLPRTNDPIANDRPDRICREEAS